MKTWRLVLAAALATLPPCGSREEVDPEEVLRNRLASLVKYRYTPAIVVATGPGGTQAFGAAQEDSIFRVASITKTFTGLLLAQMVLDDTVKLEDLVSKYLPVDFSPEITLLTLATHTAGLPLMPEDLGQLPEDDPDNPLATYSEERLFDYLKTLDLQPSPHSYSNLGYVLLGMALEKAGGQSYAELVQEYVSGPAGLKDSAVELTSEQEERKVAGHYGLIPFSEFTPYFDQDGVFIADRAMHSTAEDLLALAELELGASDQPLAAATALTHSQNVPDGERDYGLGIVLEGDLVWHNGEWAGYHGFFGANRANGKTVAILTNSTSFDSTVGASAEIDALGREYLSSQ